MSTPEVERIIEALAEVESGNDLEAWGDYLPGVGGAAQAMGRWQLHPARLITLLSHYGEVVGDRESWDDLVRRLLAKMIAANLDRSPVDLALYWHLGHWPVPGDLTSEYARKFADAYLKVRPPA